MNRYEEQRFRHQNEFNAFPIMYAFSNEQFDKGMIKLGLNPDDTDKIYSIGEGGYIRKSDHKAFHEMLDRFKEEDNKAIINDINGNGFIKEMFLYELKNREYSYTRDSDTVLEVIEALGFTPEDIVKNKNLINGLDNALKEINGR